MNYLQCFDEADDLSFDAFMAVESRKRPYRAITKGAPSSAWAPPKATVVIEPVQQVPRVPTGRELRRKKTLANQRAKSIRLVAGIETLRLDPCAYCGDPNPTTHDHIVPFSKGGGHDMDNLTRACWACNKAKGTQSLLRFLVGRAARNAT